MTPKDKIAAPDITAMKHSGTKIAMVTAYDYTFARIFDEAGVDVLLVGDSLGMVVQGRKNTLGVTMDHMIYHTHCVARGAKRAHVVLDLPFMSYQSSVEDAIRVSGMALKNGRAEAVKLEGGEELAGTVHALTSLGIPVMGHVGLMPQRVQKMGGYKIQGRGKEEAKHVLHDAQAIADAGAYCLVLEGIPMDLAKKITEQIKIPTVGIGSGPHCDGQVLVCYDMLGMNPDFSPKFVKKFANLHEQIRDATHRFIEDIRSGAFPAAEHSFQEKS